MNETNIVQCLKIHSSMSCTTMNLKLPSCILGPDNVDRTAQSETPYAPHRFISSSTWRQFWKPEPLLRETIQGVENDSLAPPRENQFPEEQHWNFPLGLFSPVVDFALWIFPTSTHIKELSPERWCSRSPRTESNHMHCNNVEIIHLHPTRTAHPDPGNGNGREQASKRCPSLGWPK